MSGRRGLARSALALAAAVLVACGSHVSPGPRVLGRADVEAMVRGLRGEVVRIDRLASKRMTVSELRHGQETIDLGARPAALLVWVVAVSGELRPPVETPAPPRPWGVYVYDSTTGDPLASQLGSSGGWPPYFDRLPDH